MKRNARRHISAVVLLAVYLSMVLLASFHVHPTSLNIVDDCEMCVNHQAHGGHLTSGDSGQHVCLLCQFLTFNYLAVAVAAVVFILTKTPLYRAAFCAAIQLRSRGIIGLRAPPSFFL
ncbi:hypothetical protein L6475_11675 [Prevotella sp. E9-3]|uniref:hypothetical protein n=1 Tax=Prevotella sp. E9-3 TaxID=2913621 RepID=UPI001EDABD96|nr:hypothetical protein [Prevotella sp. E9-3]UKK47863.1 hypothetical protein L6475_11675 [Prevotella sp. E9-3]